MKSLLFCAIFAVVAFLASADDDKPCYDWDKDLKLFKDSCIACKEDPAKPDVQECLHKYWNLTDDEGNVLASRIAENYLLTVDETKKEAVKEAVEGCVKDKTEPMKDRKEIDAVWKCTHEALAPICPKSKEMMEAWKKDPELEGCMYEEE